MSPAPRLLRSTASAFVRIIIPRHNHAATHATAAAPPPEKRAVAGSFIFRFSPDGQRPQVALFRRSIKAKAYRHCYAPISGRVKADDDDELATAWRELAEETGLGPRELRLIRQGKPYSFVDEALAREWIINPFAFALRSDGPGEAAIKLDSEHESFAWFDPAEVPDDNSDDGAFRGVPHLLDSLRRVYFELELQPDAAALLDDGLRRLRDDRKSSARKLSVIALDTFIRILPVLDRPVGGSAARWWRSVRIVAWHLWKSGHEDMGSSTLRLLLDAMTLIEARLPLATATASLPEGGFIDAIVDDLQAISRQRREPDAALQDAFVSFIRHQQASHADPSPVIRILVLSSNATVISCLNRARAAQDLYLDIHIRKSRPFYKGRVAKARNIADSNASIDAARDAHILLLGADSIDDRGHVRNKTGSISVELFKLLIASHVKARTVKASKIVVVAHSGKILPADQPSAPKHIKRRDFSRVWPCISPEAAQTDKWNISDEDFQWMFDFLIDCYITESGITTKEEIAASAREARARASHFFDDL
ncbi:Methylthioribose-1-phosphate isomerase [Ophiocordyceps camponoti-floridani]|uniref:Methylthioribose-1-phosphate isomerase n=1 Tax=Ophiocordyceps camponoti-floridani TaxID=2030778 RepID=A0A8H4QDU6_9HYPO|nr:Methylthioribose-1-phosphate isomerase [Ophiocordyceps camponoti-floridani]